MIVALDNVIISYSIFTIAIKRYRAETGGKVDDASTAVGWWQ